MILQMLYEAEIHFEIYTGDGINVALGDDTAGFVAESQHDTIEEAEKWLWAEAKKRYPKAKCFKKENIQ